MDEPKLEEALKYVAIRLGDQANDLKANTEGLEGLAEGFQSLAGQTQVLAKRTDQMENRSREMQAKLEEVPGHLETGARSTGDLRARVERIEKHLGLEAS